MPLYEYQCEACAHRFERIQKFSDPPIESCPTCGGAVKKLISSPAIQFKGTGWYITDYAKKPAGDGKGGSAAGTSTSSDTTASSPSSGTTTPASGSTGSSGSGSSGSSGSSS
jgi:putative FmdB family regulatory protein